jgi:hypothetical protein
MIEAWERRLRDALLRGDVPPDGLALRAGALVVRARWGSSRAVAPPRGRRVAGVGAVLAGASSCSTRWRERSSRD